MNNTISKSVVLCVDGEEMPITRSMAHELCKERLCEPDDEHGEYFTATRGIRLSTIQQYILYGGC